MGAFIGEIIALSMMALALGMDAFSVALGMGLLRLRLRQMFYIGLTIGLFHILMPLAGMAVGACCRASSEVSRHTRAGRCCYGLAGK